MEYEVGDIIEVKTWEELAKEFGLGGSKGQYVDVAGGRTLCKTNEGQIQEAKTNRIFTIKRFINYKNDPKFEFYVEESPVIIGRTWVKRKISDKYKNEEINDKCENEKIFKDLLGRKIKIGDNVLHLWTKTDSRGYPQDGKGAIKKKLATVISQTSKGIGIEWRDPQDKKKIKKSTVFNTQNRLIVFDGKKLNLEIEDIVKDVEEAHEKYKKSMATKRKKLKAELKVQEEINITLVKKNTELEEAIKALTEGSERFNMLDL